jgi:hypothetical protein
MLCRAVRMDGTGERAAAHGIRNEREREKNLCAAGPSKPWLLGSNARIELCLGLI